MKATNPATNKPIKEYDDHTDEEVRQMIERAHRAYREGLDETIASRAAKMKRAGEVLRERRETYANLMVAEMGKPIAQARGEIDKCAWVCDYYAENAELFLADEPIETDAAKSYVAFRPIGVVLAVMPWNFPFWQVFRFAAPALTAGNAGILKHASNVPGCALAIEECFRDAGFAPDLFRTALVPSKRVEPIIRHPLVRAATLTGSTPAGKAVARIAGEELKKTVLELGGSDPYVILEDADLDAAAETCATSRLINGGQSCIAAKRFIVVEAAYDEFREKFLAAMKAKKMGDPTDEASDLGPQATSALRDELHEQVRQSVEKGATVLLGGEVPEREGAWYPPTVLEKVERGMPAFDDELFGPVAPLIKVADEEAAIEAANDTPFGLGAAVFTRDEARGERIAKERFDAGACFVNAFVKSDPRLPFGGVKESGYGRELSAFGMREFLNVKTVYVA